LPWFYSRGVTTGHVCSWLRFASQRLTGELRLWLPLHMHEVHTHGEVMLPVCGRFTAISLAYVDYTPRLRFPLCPAGGVFTALAALTVKRACLENRELEELVSSRCPRLKELVLEDITLLSRHHILSIRIYDRTHLRSYGLTVPPCWMTVVGSNSKLPPQSSRSCPCAYGVWAWTLTSPHPSSPRCTGANPGSIDYFLVFITPISPCEGSRWRTRGG
jgi:hypothetical protein